MQSAINRLEAEKAELESVLTSGVLGRTNNLVRLLSFVCEKYFEGKIDDVKEYSIAVQALGRSEDFDPQVDTIVRVTAHALRKRLEDFYRSAGAQHAVQICLPPGHYTPKFLHKSDLDSLAPAESNGRHNDHAVNGATQTENGFAHPPSNGIVLPTETSDAGSPQPVKSSRTFKLSSGTFAFHRWL